MEQQFIWCSACVAACQPQHGDQQSGSNLPAISGGKDLVSCMGLATARHQARCALWQRRSRTCVLGKRQKTRCLGIWLWRGKAMCRLLALAEYLQTFLTFQGPSSSDSLVHQLMACKQPPVKRCAFNRYLPPAKGTREWARKCRIPGRRIQTYRCKQPQITEVA